MIAFVPIVMSIAKNSFGFIVEHWKPITIISMVAVILYQNNFQTEYLKFVGLRTIPGIEEEIQVKEEQLAECEGSRVELKSQIESVNTQIQEWSDISSSLQEQNTKLEAELRNQAEESQKKVQDILDGYTPGTCEESIQYLKDAVEELKW